MPDATLDPETSYFTLPEDYMGAQPSAAPALPPSLQSFLSNYLMPTPGDSGPQFAVSPTASTAPVPVPSSLLPVPTPSNPVPSGLQAFQAMQNLPPNTGALPVQPTGPQMPTPPTGRSVPGWLKALGAISALSGGAGAGMIDAYQQAGDAKDQTNYQQQLQQSELKQQQADRQQANSQQQAQQKFENTQTTARSGDALLDSLQGMDPASQEARVQSLLSSPDQLQAYGRTADDLRSEFYDAQGKFRPVVSAVSAAQTAALQRAQNSYRSTLVKISLPGQQAAHDSYASNPAEWERISGIPYDSFKPGQLQTSLDAEAKQSNSQADAVAKQQASFRTWFFGQTPAVQQSYYAGMGQAGFQQQSGLPTFTPGMTSKDATALLSATDREADAVRSDATRNRTADQSNATTIRGQDLAHGDRQLSMDLQQRAQNLAFQNNTANRFLRQQEFQQRYGSQAPAAQTQYDAIGKQRQSIQRQMTELSQEGRDKNGNPTLSLRDQGRIDAHGQPVPNPVPTEAYQSYMSLKAMDDALNEQQYLISRGRAAAPVAPMPVTNVTNGYGQPMPGVSIPDVPQLPGFAPSPSPAPGGAMGAVHRMTGTPQPQRRSTGGASPQQAARARLQQILGR